MQIWGRVEGDITSAGALITSAGALKHQLARLVRVGSHIIQLTNSGLVPI
jgi:hypothetical protein